MSTALPIPTRAELIDQLVAARIAGPVTTTRENNLANFRLMANRDPGYLFGLQPRAPWTFEDVLALMAERCGVSADPLARLGRRHDRPGIHGRAPRRDGRLPSRRGSQEGAGTGCHWSPDRPARRPSRGRSCPAGGRLHAARAAGPMAGRRRRRPTPGTPCPLGARGLDGVSGRQPAAHALAGADGTHARRIAGRSASRRPSS